MGVPGFFKWLSIKAKALKCSHNLIMNNLPSKEGEEGVEVDVPDWLLIDTNCLMHPTCFEVLAEIVEDEEQNGSKISNPRMEDICHNRIIQKIMDMIKLVNPKEGVYIAIDGVAPVAKIKQQRYRRFKSIVDRNLDNAVRKKHGKEKKRFWNNSAITPGTEFMERFHGKILQYLKTHEMDIKVIYSSCKTPSEGEHKLLQFIRENKKTDNIMKYVVYGLDADLIFLSLAAENPNIHLLREAQEFDKKNSSNEYNYVSIDFMRNFIFGIISSIVDHKNIDFKEMLEEVNEKEGEISNDIQLISEENKNRIVKDFIFFCYLLGNDFVPHLQSINIYENGIDFLLEKYSDLLIENHYEAFIINMINTKDGKTMHYFDQKLFCSLINSLALEESDNLKNLFVSKKRRLKCSSTDPYEIEKFNIDNLNFKIEDPILLGSDDSEQWKRRYYCYYYPHLEKVSEEEYLHHIDTMVVEYIRGLKWITRYYFDSCPSWSWYYPYDYPPFLEDINSFLERNPDFTIKSLKFSMHSPIAPFNQLLLVLPPQSSFLVPKTFQDLMTDNKSELVKKGLYPTSVKLDLIGKQKHWMAIPQLLPIDLKSVYNEYKTIVNNMIEEKGKGTKLGNEYSKILSRNKYLKNYEFF